MPTTYTKRTKPDTKRWLGIDSSHFDSVEAGGFETSPVTAMLNGTGSWINILNLTGTTLSFYLDLGATYKVTKVRGRSNGAFNADPTNVNIYVSTDNSTWGGAVAEDLDFQDTSSWVESSTFEKVGRYVRVEVDETENTVLAIDWGGGFPGFDIEISEWIERIEPSTTFTPREDEITNETAGEPIGLLLALTYGNIIKGPITTVWGERVEPSTNYSNRTEPSTPWTIRVEP